MPAGYLSCEEMIRGVLSWIGVCVLSAAATAADEKTNSLTALQQDVEKKSADWNTQATGLEKRLSQLLPCDARVKTAIDDVNRASAARIASLTSYLQAVNANVKNEIEIVKGLQNGNVAAAEWQSRVTEIQQEEAALNERASALGESAKRRASLTEPQKNLIEIVELRKQLAGNADQRKAQSAALASLLQNLLEADQARAAALDAELKAVAAEGGQWSSYYAARTTRAQAECSVINPGGPAPRAQQPNRKQP